MLGWRACDAGSDFALLLIHIFFSAHKDYESLSEESRRLIDNEYSSDQCVG